MRLAKITHRPSTTAAIPTNPQHSPALVLFDVPTCLVTTSTPLHNPYTGHPTVPHPNDCATDIATTLCISYKAACFILNSQYEESQRLSNEPRNSAHYKLVTGSPISYALHYMRHCPGLFTALHLITMERIAATVSPNTIPNPVPTQQTSTGFSPLTCDCHSCGARFKVLRTDPDLYRYVPEYCIFCGAKDLSVNQGSTEDTAFDALAGHYGMARPIIEMIYNQWASTNTRYSTFAQYIAAFRASNAPKTNA